MTCFSEREARWGFFGIVLAVLGGMMASSPGVAQAQTRWLQNVEVITPIREGGVTRALLDSLFAVMQRETVTLKRSPDSDTLSYYALENDLLDTGLDFTSASHLFIGYRLQANTRQFQSDITHLYFIYRPEEMDGVDSPIFYVDVDQPVIQEVLTKSGTPMPNNEAAVVTFHEQLVFHKLPESTVVSVSGNVIRDPAKAASEKKRLMATIRRFVFN